MEQQWVDIDQLLEETSHVHNTATPYTLIQVDLDNFLEIRENKQR